MISTIRNQYLNKLRDNASDNYTQYLAKSGKDIERIYLDSMAEADANMQIATAGGGAMAQSLADMGLSDSGYAEHLKEKMNAERKSLSESFTNQMAKNEYLNEKGYEKYLSDYEKVQEEISRGVIDAFVASGSFSLEDAYKRAVTAGANEIYAMQTATKARSAAIEKAMNKAIEFAKLYSLSAKKASDYALSLGLPEFYANKVYKEIAGYNKNSMRFFESMTPEEYHDYILSQK